jgi:hypothetical protein
MFSWRAIPRGFIVLLIWAELCVPAGAHIGPPFPIIENQRVGPCIISLWTHPDVGTGTFFVIVDPAAGSKVPADLKIKIGVQPESGRLAEIFYNTERDDSQDQLQYKTSADFDRDEFWRVHLVLESSAGGGEAFSRVEATPTAFGRFGLLFFLLPFLAVGFLWFRGVSKKRDRTKRRRAQALQAQSDT